MTDANRRNVHFLRLVPSYETAPLSEETFTRPAWQNTLFANNNDSLVVFLNCDQVTDSDFLVTLNSCHPKTIFDVRQVPRFDLGRMSRRFAFDLFRKIGAQYIDLTSVHRLGASSSETSPATIGEAIQDAKSFSRKNIPAVVLVDSNQFSEDYISTLLDCLPTDGNEPWDVLRLPYERDVSAGTQSRNVIFISHANPSNNEFAIWISQQLTLCGYSVWCDVQDLAAGDRFWDEIEECIRKKAAKFIVIVSREAQAAAGVLDEIDLAVRVERSQNLRRFVLPIRLDDIPFSEIRANLGRKNFVDFSENWAAGLRAIVNTLERDNVPRSESRDPTIAGYLKHGTKKGPQLVEKQEVLTTNWLPIAKLPPFVYLYEVNAPIDRINQIADRLGVPFFRHLRLVGLFCNTDSLEHKPNAGDLTLQYKVPIGDFLSGKTSNGPSILRQTANNACVSMLRQAWNKEMDSRGLLSFALASNSLAWYFPIDLLDRNTVAFSDSEGKRRRKVVVNWSNRRKVYWHLAVEARPVLGPRPRLVLRLHVIFTVDGRTPLVSTDRMHALRRRFCRSWWNDRWRDLLVAFVAWLNSGPQGCSLGTAAEVHFDNKLLTLLSPLSVEDTEAKLGGAAAEDNEEELSLDDDYDEFDESSELEIVDPAEAVD